MRARSGDAPLLGHLRGCHGRGSLHSAFTHALNLLTPDGRLMTLAAAGSDDAPWTLVVDAPSFPALEAGQPIIFAPGTLDLGEPGALRVRVDSVRAWEPVPPALEDLLPHTGLLERALHSGQPGGMLATGHPSPMERALSRGRERLVAAITGGGDLRAGVLGLLGLGPGLTPAGDDFMTGLALIAALPGSRLRPFTTALRQVLADHPGRTTLLSATTLTHASDGRVRASILDVLHQLPGGAIDAAAARVLAIGHTSGTDLLSGLVTALHLEQQLRGSL